MIGIAEAFATRYAEARKKFLEAAATAGLRSESFVHPLLGIDGETLAVDVALDGPTRASKMLMITSASHGVDGDCGSGVQVFALHDQEWRDKARDAGVAVLYVHALDPQGFSHGQRSTDDQFSQQTFCTILRQHVASSAPTHQVTHQLAWIDIQTGPGPDGLAPFTGALLQSVRTECPGVLTTALALEIGTDTRTHTDAWQGLVISQARQAMFQAVEALNL